MNRPSLLLVFLLLIGIGATGCSINPGFNQLDFVKRLAKYQTKAELEQQLWTAKIGDYEQLAIPVEHEKRLTFYLKDGTEIDFVDWDITALRNWNYYGKSIQVSRAENALEHELIDGTKITLECTEYLEVSEGFLKEGSIRSAQCQQSNGQRWSYKNAVAMNDAGEAIWMLHHLAPDMPPLEMRLNGAENAASLNGVDLRLSLP